MKVIVLAVLCFAVALEAKPYGLGLGLGRGIGIGMGGGRSEFGSGANGADREMMYDRGSNGFHNRGTDNNRLTQITTAEQNHSHDVGSHNNFDSGLDRGSDFGRYNHGMSGYENGFGL